jgi:hypothetical protein
MAAWKNKAIIDHLSMANKSEINRLLQESSIETGITEAESDGEIVDEDLRRVVTSTHKKAGDARWAPPAFLCH